MRHVHGQRPDHRPVGGRKHHGTKAPAHRRRPYPAPCRLTLSALGMHCAACEKLVQLTTKKVPGVMAAVETRPTSTVTVTAERPGLARGARRGHQGGGLHSRRPDGARRGAARRSAAAGRQAPGRRRPPATPPPLAVTAPAAATPARDRRRQGHTRPSRHDLRLVRRGHRDRAAETARASARRPSTWRPTPAPSSSTRPSPASTAHQDRGSAPATTRSSSVTASRARPARSTSRRRPRRRP